MTIRQVLICVSRFRSSACRIKVRFQIKQLRKTKLDKAKSQEQKSDSVADPYPEYTSK